MIRDSLARKYLEKGGTFLERQPADGQIAVKAVYPTRVLSVNCDQIKQRQPSRPIPVKSIFI